MSKVTDLTNRTFGLLTVIERDYNQPPGRAYWICKCKCGNIVSVKGNTLQTGGKRSCGCLRESYLKNILSKQTFKDLTGQRFGKLVVLERDEERQKEKNISNAVWKCQCDCGKITYVDSPYLIRGKTKSCGCLVSVGENKIETLLMQHRVNYKTQYTFPDLTGETNNQKLRFDFAIFNSVNDLVCLIEFQGEQHYDVIPSFRDTQEKFEKRLRYDNKKREYCKMNNILLIEISYLERETISWEFLQNLFSVNNVDWS